MSDFFYQNRTALKLDLALVYDSLENSKDVTEEKKILANLIPQLPDKSIQPFDSLWMCLFSKLGDLCVDPRPAVRKSAGQTLFSTISAHGGLLENDTWYSVLWKVSMFVFMNGERGYGNQGRFCNNSEMDTLISKRLSVENKAKLSQLARADFVTIARLTL